jgi:3-oxoacyl-[acyl-carrier protein] reductase
LQPAEADSTSIGRRRFTETSATESPTVAKFRPRTGAAAPAPPGALASRGGAWAWRCGGATLAAHPTAPEPSQGCVVCLCRTAPELDPTRGTMQSCANGRLKILSQHVVAPAPCREVYTEGVPQMPPAPGADTSNSMDMTEKLILVVGGSRGIGASCVEMLARRGADVAFTYVSNAAAAAKLEQAVCAEGHGCAASFRANISSQADMEAAVAGAVARFGRPLDGLVCSAGVFEPTPIAEWNVPYQDKCGTEAEFQRVLNINVMGTIIAMKAALTSWTQVGGSIVIITSTAGQRGSSIYSAYSASKGAQIMFMRSMAQELAPRRIRVNCVAPGWTETDMARNNPDFAEHTAEIAASIPLGRPGLPEDVGAAASWLLSDLSPFVTGSTITVDGGFDMRG